MQAGEPATLCSHSLRRLFSSVNAKQLARPALQAGPSRCESGHGYHFVHVAQLDLERHRAKVEAAGATPAVDTSLPLCLSSHRSGFVNRYSSVQVRPGAPISNQDRGVISSISPCDGDGPGANPGFLTNENENAQRAPK